MNKKRAITLLTLTASVLAFSGSLSACNSYDGLTINFWHTFGKTPADSIEAQAQTFASLIEAHEGVKLRIKFTYKGSYDDILSNITKSFASGETPTIAVAYPDHVADYFAAESTPGQYIVNLDNYMNDPEIGFGKESWLGDQHDSSDFVEAFLKEGQDYSREGTYSLPYMKSSEVMFYNLSAVRKAMPYYDPTIETDDDIKDFMDNISWNELMDFCEIINDNKAAILDSLLVPAFYDSDGNLFISKMYQNNIPFASLNEDGSASIDFNGHATSSFTPSEDQITAYNETVGMLSGLKSSYDKGLFTTKGVYGEYGSNNFVQQKTIFSIGSSGGAGYNFPSSSTFDVGICKVPSSNNNPMYVSQGPTLTVFNSPRYSTSENAVLTKYAYKFIKYLTNGEVNSDLCINGSEGYVPVRESAYSTEDFLYFMENGEKYAKTADVVIHDIDGNYINTPVFKGSATLRDEVAGALADVMRLSSNDTESIETVLNRCLSNAISKM